MGLFSRFHKNEQKNNSESVSLSPEEKFKKMVPANTIKVTNIVLLVMTIQYVQFGFIDTAVDF